MADQILKRPCVRQKWSLEQRLDYYTDRSAGVDACWLWTGHVNGGNGEKYAVMWWDGRNWRAHRLIWTATRGWIPPGLLICHHCDNPKCVNPEHLFLGTHLDNARDKQVKGRGFKGNKAGWKQMSADFVRAIRADERLKRVIASDYGITPRHVTRIKSRQARAAVSD